MSIATNACVINSEIRPLISLTLIQSVDLFDAKFLTPPLSVKRFSCFDFSLAYKNSRVSRKSTASRLCQLAVTLVVCPLFSVFFSPRQAYFVLYRVDGLSKRAETPAEMTEHFVNRDDFLYYRQVVFGKRPKKVVPATTPTPMRPILVRRKQCCSNAFTELSFWRYYLPPFHH